MRNLDPQNIDQMVALRGMVIRTSQIIPDLKQAFFRCIVCNASTEVRRGACILVGKYTGVEGEGGERGEGG